MSNYKIEDVEGIGPVTGDKLRTAGISNTDELLAHSKTPLQRQALSDKTGLTGDQILKFANMVDLYRVNGIGSEYAHLLEATGVDTVTELAQRSPENLSTALSQVNELRKLTRKTPGESEVKSWVNQAKVLPGVLEY